MPEESTTDKHERIVKEMKNILIKNKIRYYEGLSILEVIQLDLLSKSEEKIIE